jgi:uncharacterized protein YjbI with pentapeptide repeats
MTSEQTAALFRACEARRSEALLLGRSAEEAHELAKARWNAWAKGILGERKGAPRADATDYAHDLSRARMEEPSSDWRRRARAQLGVTYYQSRTDGSSPDPLTRRFVDSRDIRFDAYVFPGSTDLRNTIFVSRVSFKGAVFADEVLFAGSNFSMGVSFEGALFLAEANFDEALFQNDVSFEGARFGGGSSFNGARFAEPASFDRASFGNACFDNADFHPATSFREATFRGHASFIDTGISAASLRDAAFLLSSTFFEDLRTAL